MGKIILHVDFNNYFASVECIDKPELKNIPVAVCGDPKMRHGIVLSKNDAAKSFGVLTGESSYAAKSKCRNLVILKPDYSKYLDYARKARDIYCCYSDKVYPYGLDEAWVNVSGYCDDERDGKVLADEIRQRVKSELKLTASVGVSFNFVFAKLASDMKKPDATSVIAYTNFREAVRNIPAFDMLFVGSVTRKTLKNMGILTIGDLANSDPVLLNRRLGKRGYMLWQFANGNDSSFNPCISSEEEIKSVGNTITPPKDIDNERDAFSFLYILSCAVSNRLVRHELKASCVSIHIRLSDFSSLSRQTSFPNAINDADTIFQYSYYLLKNNHDWSAGIRSIGVKASRLQSAGYEQLFFPINEKDYSIHSDVKGIIEDVKKKYGHFDLEKSATIKDFDIGIF